MFFSIEECDLSSLEEMLVVQTGDSIEGDPECGPSVPETDDGGSASIAWESAGLRWPASGIL